MERGAFRGGGQQRPRLRVREDHDRDIHEVAERQLQVARRERDTRQVRVIRGSGRRVLVEVDESPAAA